MLKQCDSRTLPQAMHLGITLLTGECIILELPLISTTIVLKESVNHAANPDIALQCMYISVLLYMQILLCCASNKRGQHLLQT